VTRQVDARRARSQAEVAEQLRHRAWPPRVPEERNGEVPGGDSRRARRRPASAASRWASRTPLIPRLSRRRSC